MKARTLVRRSIPTELEGWRDLRVGDAVHIMKNAQVVSRGLVEEVSDSGRVLWIKNESLAIEIYNQSDGVSVRRV